MTDVANESTAARAGLQAGDRIADVDGTPATAVVLNTAIQAKKPGETIALHVFRSGKEMTIQVEIAPNVKNTYQLSISDGSSPAQQEILKAWLRKAL